MKALPIQDIVLLCGKSYFLLLLSILIGVIGVFIFINPMLLGNLRLFTTNNLFSLKKSFSYIKKAFLFFTFFVLFV